MKKDHWAVLSLASMITAGFAIAQGTSAAVAGPRRATARHRRELDRHVV